MKRWKITPTDWHDRSLLPAVQILLRGGVIVYPTETLYGLGAFPFSAVALRKVYELKQRSRAKPLPLIADSLDAVRKITQPWPELAERLAAVFWPGPLSLVLDANEELPSEVVAGTGHVAVRVSSHPIARNLAARLGGFIVSTSANVSGQAPCRDPDELVTALLERVDAVIDDGILAEGPPSTLVRVDPGGAGTIRVLRRGAVSDAEIERVAGQAVTE